MKSNLVFLATIICVLFACSPKGQEYHVSPEGDDLNIGSETAPFNTISAAAELAQPGDKIWVHEGVYRERINPPRGGLSDENRIIYQAVPGDEVIIKGSEKIAGWENVENDTWKVTIPDTFFGDFNPYQDTIYGDWFNRWGRTHHTGAVYLDGHWLTEAKTFEEVINPAGENALWFTKPGDTAHGLTTIWAQFKDSDPNESNVEINVRQTVFYPKEPGVNYITIKGFIMEQAATPWAPPTAEQIGLIGTHWSKGWVIENNIIRYSTCVGITLGKHGDEWDNTSQNTAEGYVKTIERATARGWSKDKIGSHIVRNNEISDCEQAGIVGSMGAVFSTITDNEIHDIHIRRLFTGAEMAGIKIHAPIDGLISNNHIYRCCRGIWLDWMAQGTRVSCNLLHDNGPFEDLFLEVNHGPLLIDNNISLSPKSILVNSQGGAYVHNLFSGALYVIKGEKRKTPYHPANSTTVAGYAENPAGDERYYNNIMVGKSDFSMYDDTGLPVFMEGNIYLAGAKPGKIEEAPLVLDTFDPQIRLSEESDGFYLEGVFDKKWLETKATELITTEILGKVVSPDLPYLKLDGNPYTISTDYFGQERNTTNPFPGPFEIGEDGKLNIRIWESR